MMSVELHAKIRQLFATEQLSARQIALKLNISRNTVRKALQQPLAPTYHLQQPRTAPALGPFKARIEALLEENRRLPKKQRYTARKIYQIVKDEGFTGSPSSVNTFAVNWRKLNKAPKLFLPLEFEPGQDAQVDWGEAEVILVGVRQTVQVFVMRLNYSRRSFVMAFPSQKQEAFFEGHVKAFLHFGGVPHRLSYDNLSTAVKILSEGRVRQESRAFTAFKSYYLYQSHFCTPGQGHEKGGVEHAVGFSRRNFLVPLPHCASFDQLNAYLLEQCRAEDQRIVSGQTRSIGELWAEERVYLRPLPLRQFECCVTRTATLTPYSQLQFETNRYSVPVEQARRQLLLKAYPFKVEIFARDRDGEKLVASHPRSYATNQDIFDPLHYLPLLEQRPGAFEYAKPLKRWKADWPPVYHQLLALLTERQPDGQGVKEFVRILELHKHYPPALIEKAVSQALGYGCAQLEGVQQCLHQLLHPAPPMPLLDLSSRPALAALGNQAVDLSCYEQLMERQG